MDPLAQWEIAKALNLDQLQAATTVRALVACGELQLSSDGKLHIHPDNPAYLAESAQHAMAGLRTFAEETGNRLLDAVPDDPELDALLVVAAFCLEQVAKRIDGRAAGKQQTH